ncbi:hypothetical protein PCO85_09270 [Prodigiosinella aquatilis]|nr:hypothetical protein [Prodigiosinella sp. LS101]WJV55551.1 hypothetical protein PCO85_09270 [Prodigiosinella sp. LS101]WJV59912.1 hypothetical protein PCO84_09275 [Pectobacteriaceae bacterium C111]
MVVTNKKSRPLRRDRHFYQSDSQLRLNHQPSALDGDNHWRIRAKPRRFQPAALQRELRQRLPERASLPGQEMFCGHRQLAVPPKPSGQGHAPTPRAKIKPPVWPRVRVVTR